MGKKAKQMKEKISALYAENQSLKSEIWKQNIKILKMCIELRKFNKIKDCANAEKVNEWIKTINRAAQRKNLHMEK